MVKIRMKRMGMKKNPFYRVVVADERSPRDGRFIDELGYYDPMKKPSLINIDKEKALDWMQKGAQPTDSARSLLKRAGVLEKESMRELVEYLAKSLVDQPDQVVVTETEGPEAVIVELNVAPEDMGKVIGKQGRIAKAIRTVVKAAASRTDKPVFVEIQ